jgi:hypothetical protein
LIVLALAAPPGGASASAPAVASIAPRAGVGADLTVIIDGRGFEATASTVEVHDAKGQIVARGSVSSRTPECVVASLPLAGAPPGPYTVVVVNPDGTRSDGVALTLTCELKVSPATGPPGTVFTYTGRGFKGGFGVTSHLEGPDGLEWQAKRFPTTAAGTFEHPILSGEFRPGTYTVWATDDYTRIAAPKATFRVLSSAGAGAPR